MNNNCKICNSNLTKIFTGKILNKYSVDYFHCDKCLFIQTEEPYWLDEAYNSGAISALDVGILSRNLILINRTKIILSKLFPNLNNLTGVDYGGGHGIFVRMIRDLGFNFYRQDMYAENLYARYFDVNDLPKSKKYDILTAFEVLEHLPNPIEEIKKMFNYADILLFSTELQPSNDLNELENWWYMAFETGQHVSFYNKTTFQEIAKIFNAYYYTDSINLHIVSRTKFLENPFTPEKTTPIKKTIIQRIVSKINNKVNRGAAVNSSYVNPESLTMVDFEYVKNKLQNNNF